MITIHQARANYEKATREHVAACNAAAAASRAFRENVHDKALHADHVAAEVHRTECFKRYTEAQHAYVNHWAYPGR